MAKGSKTVVYSAMGANAVIAASKFAVGLLTGSAAMLAEAAHSLADTINQVFLLVSINLGDNPADEDHPYGHGKERFFWAFLAAIFIFIAGAVFSLYEGAQKVLHPEAHHGSLWPAYLVLGLAFLFDSAVLVIALREVRHQAEAAGLTAREFLRETSDTTLKTALYEDAAATTGVVVAALGLFIVQVTGNPIFDGLASVMIGIILIYVAIMLGREARDLLLGSAAPHRVRRMIEEAISSFPEVRQIVTVLTMQLGVDSILVTGELNVRDDLTTDEIEDVMTRISERIRQQVPQVRNIYLEPHRATEGGMRRVESRRAPD
ncbi:MAG: cation transporter [Chloroflexia bacterium]|nr:cation transporter [Chloroflexia bacterium]